MSIEYLENYLNRLRNKGNIQLAASISKTAEEVGQKYLETFDFMSHQIGLLFGNVQSGKTGQMFGIVCKAADLGFPAFLVLTTDNIVLQEQTLERVRTDLSDFLVLGENDSKEFTENRLIRPVIVVIKKNSRMLRLWANVFNNTGFMKGNLLFIIDDEADAASLNTLVNKDKQSSINRYIDSIKTKASSSIYLQVTGTPQAILLQSYVSQFKPFFTYYFEPGSGYLGGDFFFPNIDEPKSIVFTDRKTDQLCQYSGSQEINVFRSLVIRHLIVSAQIFGTGGVVSNCLIHPSVKNAVQSEYADAILKELNYLRNNEEIFESILKNVWYDVKPEKSKKLTIDEGLNAAKQLLQSSKVLILNQKHDVEIDDYSSGCNFIVGGNTLGRGVTFPSLQTILYTRTSKKPQADTMWQHSRMFGYDRDPGLMTVFIDHNLYKLFKDINASNNSMIAQIKKNHQDIKIHYPDGLNPTRANVLDNRKVNIIPGGTNYYPMDPNNIDLDALNSILKPFSEAEQYYQASLKVIQKILKYIIPSADFKLNAFIGMIDAIVSENPTAQGILIVRRNRNVTQGTGALLSSNDFKLGDQFPDSVVLTMYEVCGKGWRKPIIWVPNIKMPENHNYYIVED